MQKTQTMAKPKKKKEQKRAVKNQEVVDSKGKPTFSTMLPEVTVTDKDPDRNRAYRRSLYKKNPILKDVHESTDKAAKIVGEAALLHPAIGVGGKTSSKVYSLLKNSKTIKKLSNLKKAFKYKYGKTLKTSDIPKDVWTHRTSSKEALKTWDKNKKIIGRGEDLSKFTKRIDQGTFSLSKTNPNSPNFQKGRLFSRRVPGDKSFLVTRKGSHGFIPNLNRVNLKSFKGLGGSSGVGVLKPGSRSTKNLQYYQFDAPKNVYRKIEPSKLKKGGSVKPIKRKK